MAIRTGHGTGKGQPRIEVLPANELPQGVPAPRPKEKPSDRRADGRFTPGNSLASQGARARKGSTQLARMLGLDPQDQRLAQYHKAAEAFRRAQVTTLARTVGGGVCGPAPASIVATSALQLAASRYLFDHANGEREALKVASSLGNDSRQNLLAAHELCAKEAKARPAAAQAVPWLVASTEDDEGDDVTP